MSANVANVRDAYIAISKHPAHEVKVKCVPNLKAFHRKIKSLYKIYDPAVHNRWKIDLLGKSISRLGDHNIYSPCSEAAMRLLKPERFNPAQLQGLEYLKKLPQRMGIITGPAATGKTEFIVTVLQPFLYCTTSGTNPSISTAPQVLICTPDNAATDELASHIFNRPQGNEDSRQAVIIRMHSLSTETSVIDNEAHISRPGLLEPATNPDVSTADLVVASMVYRAYHESKARTYRGINDRRYILHSTSLAMWMLRISGVLADPLHTLANPKQHRTFANLFGRVAEGGEDLDPNE